MLRQSRIILKRIRKLSNGSSTRILTLQGRLINPETDQTISCRRDYGKELGSLIDGLIRDGYLIRIDEFKVALTDKGLHPYAQSWETIKVFLFKSVLIPAVVSAVTAQLTLWIKTLL
jgi:hypothetical protein